MLGMLRHDLQQCLPEIPSKKPKVDNKDLLEDSTSNDIESANVDPYFEEEFDDEFLQINVEEINMTVINENGLAINNFFDIGMSEQDQMEISEKNLTTYSQRTTNSGEDWSIDDIFKSCNKFYSFCWDR
ncbi:37_t:CDS:1, partial [Racocetra persica]